MAQMADVTDEEVEAQRERVVALSEDVQNARVDLNHRVRSLDNERTKELLIQEEARLQAELDQINEEIANVGVEAVQPEVLDVIPVVDATPEPTPTPAFGRPVVNEENE